MRWIPPLLAVVLVAGCSDYGLQPYGDGVGPPVVGGLVPVAGGDTGTAGVDTGTAGVDTSAAGIDTAPAPAFVSCTDVGLTTAQWWGSQPFSTEPDPADSSGRPFYALDYDMVGYSTVVIPDEGHAPPGTDRVYRTYLHLDAAGPRIFLDLESDDGLWVWVNGQAVGHWGGAWQQEGCVNDDADCSQFVNIPPVEITDLVHPGDNLLAVRISNAVVNAYMGVNARCAGE